MTYKQIPVSAYDSGKTDLCAIRQCNYVCLRVFISTYKTLFLDQQLPE